MFAILSIDAKDGIPVTPSAEIDGTRPPKRKRQSKRDGTGITLRVCLECRRRKVKCTGTSPCESCEWYRCRNLCVYPPTPPPSVSNGSAKKRIAKASDAHGEQEKSTENTKSPIEDAADALLSIRTMSTYKKYKHVVHKLFPDSDIKDLCEQSREQLLDKLSINIKAPDIPSKIKYTQGHELPPHSDGPMSTSNMSNSTNDLLDVLEDGTHSDYGWKELQQNLDQASVDDVNGLSMGDAARTSYLGPASVTASLKVLERISKVPIMLHKIPSQDTTKAGLVSVPNSEKTNLDLFREIARDKAQHYMDAYFDHVHPLIPLVHEKSFRHVFQTKTGVHTAWMGLYYMVMTLGAVAAHSAVSSEDVVYFSLAKKYLTLDSLGSGDFYNLDALALMSYYLHYRHQPNTAIAIMGAALRIAASLSLHRELPHNSPIDELEREQRRTRWWTLYCMDVWGLTTLGRPSFGVNVDELTLNIPRNINYETGQVVEGVLTPTSALISNIGLCKIISKIESLLVQYAVPSFDSVAELDTELQVWYDNLPADVRDLKNCPKKYYTTCCVVKWRYQNSRLILFRSYLLNCALSRAKLETFDAGTQQFVRTCRRVAMEAIRDIGNEWEHHQMACWKAVWFVFQSCMVMIISLYSEDRFDKELQMAWAECVEKGIELMNDMSRWSLAASRSIAVITSLYESSHELPASGWSPQSNLQDSLQNDSLWNEIIWGWKNTNPEGLISLEELASG